VPTPSVVKIDNVVLTDVTSVEFYYETPTDGGYLRNVRPKLARVEIARRATANPNVKLFDLVTNGDGTKKVFAGSVTIRDDANEELYTVSFEQAFIEGWSMAQTESDALGTEMALLRAAKIKFSSGKANKEVDIRQYGS
jgi:hypothetical protein